jgi:hypothetical protein
MKDASSVPATYRNGSTVLSSRICEKSGTGFLKQAALITTSATIKSSLHHMNLTMDASIPAEDHHTAIAKDSLRIVGNPKRRKRTMTLDGFSQVDR